jgi:hypothetical protein
VSESSGNDERVKWDLAFKYYQEQWIHVRHHESLRSALTFQILGAAIAIVAGYLKIDRNDGSVLAIRLTLATLLIVLGLLGWTAVTRIERAAEIHIQRARAARKSIGFLEPFASAGSQFPSLRPVYLAFTAMIACLGVCLVVAAWFLS